MKLAVLGSGSRGNATLLGSGGRWILVDAGFSGKQVEERLDTLDVPVNGVEGIVVTHEHVDHTRGIGVLARRYGIPLYMTPGTREACAHLLKGTESVVEYRPGRSFRVAGLTVAPFLTVHDAVDPVAVTVSGPECGSRVGLAMDLGRPTAQIRHSLRDCHFLVLEANHDERLLREGPYPPTVQARIASSHGHLSNHAAAQFARELLHPGLAGIILAHLSQECNRPELARRVIRDALTTAGFRGYLGVARQDQPTDLMDLTRLRSANGSDQLTLF